MTPDSVAELTCANEFAGPARISASKMNNANTNWLRFITASQGCTRKTPLPLAVAGVAPPITNGNTCIHGFYCNLAPRSTENHPGEQTRPGQSLQQNRKTKFPSSETDTRLDD